jgi:4-amino-4-deoxy-L-arabinose transferase-like glycosyltransferase
MPFQTEPGFMALPSRSEALLLAGLIFFGVLLRLAAILLFNHAPQSDELAYQSMAVNLLEGRGVIDHMGNHAMYNVGYPLFILTPIFWLFGLNLWVVKLCHALLGAMAIFLTHQIAKEAGAGKLGRLLAAAAWAFYLPASTYCVYLAKENLMIPLMLALVWCTLRLGKHASLRLAVLCGGLIGLLALTGNAALSLLGALAVALLASCRSIPKHLFLVVGTIVMSAALVAAPWMIRNHHVLGVPVLNTNGGFNLYLGNNPAATGMFVSISETPRAATWETLRREGEVKASEVLKHEAMAWIRAHPMEFFQLALKKGLYFWTPPWHAGSTPSSATESLVRALWAVQFVVLLVLAGLALVCKDLRTQPLLCLWLAVLGYTAVHMLFYVIFRYREPIMALVGVIAAMSLERMVLTMATTKDRREHLT